MDRTELIAAARGDLPLDLVIRNVNLMNVFTCEIYPADIGVYGERVALVGGAGDYELGGGQTIDGSNKWAVPGLIDTHVHIESSMVTPTNFAAAVLPFGTTTAVIDPHEIANVLGKDGVRFMIEASEGLPLRVYVSIPSTVPSVPGKETAGASFGPADVAEMLSWPRVIAVAEVMDYVGVIRSDPRMMGIIQAGHDAAVTIQGHAPLLEGRELNAYLASGARDDHEMMLGRITEQKLRLGMLPLLRNATGANTIPDILPPLTRMPFLELAFCTDDIVPADLLENGHLDRGIREAIRLGVDPALAFRWATLLGARHYQLREHGAVAPGYLADIVLLDSLEEVAVSEVIVGGSLVVEGGRLIKPLEEPASMVDVEDSVRIETIDEGAFKLKPPVADGTVDVNVMVFRDDFLVRAEVERARVEAGEIMLDSISADACCLSVVPRHGQTHAPSLAIIRGLGLRSGAMAGTLSHDCHNIVVAGRTAQEMRLAVQFLSDTGGGIVLVEEGKVLANIALPVAGLMSWKPAEEVASETEHFNRIAREKGVSYHYPMWALSFLALAVIPEVRITDLGMIDVLTQEFIPVFP